MSVHTRNLPHGEAIISVFNVGDFFWKLSEKLKVPANAGYLHNQAWLEQSLLFPTQSIHIALPGISLLVDASCHELPPDPSLCPSGYQPPPDLITQLLEQNIDPQQITHVVITHAHFDHYAFVTTERHEQIVPSFPHARYLLSQEEWQRPDLQQALHDPQSSESRTLGVLFHEGLLDLVASNLDLSPALQIIATPGETPGHQIVRVHSLGQTLYCLGDLYHHRLEYEHPTWMVHWGDHEAKLRSRLMLMEAALAENALLVAAHIPPGRLERVESDIRWIAV
jgi:glyoxylase-like metal-dependent hydrolase (beta-lactamase superfamily II)